MQSYNPEGARPLSLGFSLFARHYLGNHLIIFFSSGYLDVSVLRVGSLSSGMSSTCRVVPFGNLWIDGCMHLPKAYRSLPRPSSPLNA